MGKVSPSFKSPGSGDIGLASILLHYFHKKSENGKGKTEEKNHERQGGGMREAEKDRLENNNSFDGGLKWPGFEALVIRQARSSLEMKAVVWR